MKMIKKFYNLTFNDLYNLECLQNTQIKRDLDIYMSKLINHFMDYINLYCGDLPQLNKIYFHCFHLKYNDMETILIYLTNEIYDEINNDFSGEIIGGLIFNNFYDYQLMYYGEMDIINDIITNLLITI